MKNLRAIWAAVRAYFTETRPDAIIYADVLFPEF